MAARNRVGDDPDMLPATYDALFKREGGLSGSFREPFRCRQNLDLPCPIRGLVQILFDNRLTGAAPGGRGQAASA
jgi:hypothetical protein